MGSTVATQATRYNGMQMQSSSYGIGLPIVYGQARLAGTLIWYGDFSSVQNQQNVGKGGGGGISTSYTYSSSFQLALCEGPVRGLSQIWQDSGLVSLSDINGTFSTGTASQAAWGHLSGAAALQYPYTAWVGCVNLKLGSSPTAPNFNFEIQGLLQYDPTGSPAIIDADPSAIFSDLLTSTTHGLGFQYLGDLTLYHDYCVANGIFLSPVINQQTTMNEVLTRLLQITNSNTAWSNGKLIVIPYGDQSVTANGVTYTPPTTIRATLTDKDYVKPVRVDRKPLADLYNVIRVEWINRSNNYVTSVAEAKDQGDLDTSGAIRQQEIIDGHAIMDGSLAQQIAQILLQRALYIRNTYTFTTTMEYVALEPGDVISLTDSEAEISAEPVRIKTISEQSANELQFVCEEFPAGVAAGATQSIEAPAGFTPNVNGAPDASQPLVIFRAPQFLVDGAVEIWMGVCGAGANWGGANVLVSFDNVTYTKIGTVSPGCRYGALTAALADSTADPDTTNSFSVALDGPGSLSGGTDTEADNLATLMLVDQELIAYSSATLNGDGTYTLGNGYMRRQCYQTPHAAHAIGAPWMRIDDNIFRWKVDPSWVGTTVYIKIQPWNLYGGGLVSEASLSATTYVIGAAEEIPDTPPTPTNFVASGAANGNLLAWTNPNPAAVAITSVEYSTDNATWVVLGQVQGTHYTHVFSGNTQYYYRLRARSQNFLWGAYTASLGVYGGSMDYVSDGTVKQGMVLGANLTADIPYNGDFEQWADGQYFPDGWSGSQNMARTTTAYTGKYAMDIPPSSGGGTSSRPFSVQPGMRLNLTAWAYCGAANAGGLYLRIIWYSGDIGGFAEGGVNPDYLGYTDVLANGSVSAADTWQQIGGEVVAANASIRFARIVLYNVNTTTSYFVDRVSINPQTKLISSYLDGSDRVNTVAGGIGPLGSVASGSLKTSFSYTSTTSGITWSWTAGTLYRMDGTTTALAAGSYPVTGLSASTTYDFAPYYDEVAGAMAFVTGGNGVGSPAAAYTSQDPVAAGQAGLQAHIPLGWLSAATTASGSGGGGGPPTCCLHAEQLVELADGRLCKASDLKVGDRLTCPEGETPVVKLRTAPWAHWWRVDFSNGMELMVAPDHRFVDPSGAEVHTRDLRLEQIIQSRDGPVYVTRLEIIREASQKVSLEVGSPHTYYVQGILSHNKFQCA